MHSTSRKNPDGTSHVYGTFPGMRIQDDECRTNRIQKDFRLLNARVQNQICRNIEDFAIEANLVIPDKKNDRLDFLASDFGDRFCTYGDTPRETVVKRPFEHSEMRT